MKSHATALLLGLNLIASTALASEFEVDLSHPPSEEAALNIRCPTVFNRFDFAKWAATPTGWLLGSSDGIVTTLTAGKWALLPSVVSSWLPASNEIVNVLGQSTGNAWIYTGLNKKVIDGVALGAIIGHSLAVGSEHGITVASLVTASNLGLTYWFPNRYFHRIMHAVPHLLPERLAAAAGSKPGLGVIGISMIIILEQIAHYAESLLEQLPRYFGDVTAPTTNRLIAVEKLRPKVTVQHALGTMFIDHALFGTPADVSPGPYPEMMRNRALLLLAGASSNTLFAALPADKMDRILVDMPSGVFARLDNVSELMKKGAVLNTVLTAEELKGLSVRMTRIRSFIKKSRSSEG